MMPIDHSLVNLAVVAGVGLEFLEFIDAEFLSAGERVDAPPAQFLKTLNVDKTMMSWQRTLLMGNFM